MELTPEKAMDATTKQTDDVIHFVMLTRMAILLLNRINNFLVLCLSLKFNNWYLYLDFVGRMALFEIKTLVCLYYQIMLPQVIACYRLYKDTQRAPSCIWVGRLGTPVPFIPSEAKHERVKLRALVGGVLSLAKGLLRGKLLLYAMQSVVSTLRRRSPQMTRHFSLL